MTDPGKNSLGGLAASQRSQPGPGAGSAPSLVLGGGPRLHQPHSAWSPGVTQQRHCPAGMGSCWSAAGSR